jgi:hypothetical protein
MTTGEDLVRIARRHVGEPYHLGVVAPKTNKQWHGPWDCAELVSWCVFQSSGILYGCNNNTNPILADAFTGFWHRDVMSIGRRIDVESAATIPGAAVLRLPQPGLIGHIVFSEGDGNTIEAHSRLTGVIRGKLAGRRWDMGVLVPGIAYTPRGDPQPVPQPLLVLRLTNPQMQGKLVRDVQRALRDAGFNPGKIDGIYGPNTVAAVNAFQVSSGFVPDGEVGAQTAKALGITMP